MAEHQRGEVQRGGLMGTGIGGTGMMGGGQMQPMLTSSLKALTAGAAGGSMLVLSGLALAGTVIALTVATPLLVIFSPVLVPAAITAALVAAGFVTSVGLGVAALSVFSWMYKYLTGKHPPGADQLEQAKARFASKARDIKESAQHRLDQVVRRALTAGAAGGSMLVLSGLALAGTVIALTVATPLLVIFSPILVPAAITAALVAAGFVTSVGLGVAALLVFSWMYKYLTGKHLPGADQLERAKARFASKARDIKESAQHRLDQVQAS